MLLISEVIHVVEYFEKTIMNDDTMAILVGYFSDFHVY